MNRLSIHTAVVLLALVLQAPAATAQYLNQTYDFDSTNDVAGDIFIQPDSNYFVLGAGDNYIRGESELTWMNISRDGSNTYSKHHLGINYGGFYPEVTGRVKQLTDGGYLYPFTIQISKSPGTYIYMLELARLRPSGDTAFVRNYTDTTSWYDWNTDCAIMKDGNYLLAGARRDTPANTLENALLLKLDTSGNLLWSKTYKKTIGQDAEIRSLEVLPDGRILAGAATIQFVVLSTFPFIYYYRSSPWYLILDTAGNIQKDAWWSSGYNSDFQGSSIYRDKNGGYYTWGAYDSMLSPDPLDYDNFPNYMACLDTNFNIRWKLNFPFTIAEGHKEIWEVLQLRDSNYLIAGSEEDTLGVFHTIGTTTKGWAAKVSRSGNILWEHEYICDVREYSYLGDAKERADGSIVLVGWARNDSLPIWRQQDIWLVSVDSNGCAIPGCGTAGIAPVGHQQVAAISISPNPVLKEFTTESEKKGVLYLYDIQGRQQCTYNVAAGINHFSFPDNALPGMYIVRYISDDGSEISTTRLAYDP